MIVQISKLFAMVLVLIIASSQSLVSDPSLSSPSQLNHRSICKGDQDEDSCRSLLSELTTLSKEKHVDMFLKKSVSPVEIATKVFNDAEVLKMNADAVVAQDGSGNYRTVNEAIAAAPNNSKSRFVIYIRRGLYHEIVIISEEKTSLTLIGDGKGSTILTGDLNYADGTKTFKTATLAVDGEDVILQDIGIQNTAGPLKGPAVALRISGDRAVIYRCHIDAFQDTLYAHSQRQFYRECDIRGTVDFICGKGPAVFQFCNIEAKKPKEGQSNVITAQSREDLNYSGFSLHKCKITASSDLVPFKRTVKTFLGRPWGNYSTVAVLESYIDDLVDPLGWTPWEREDEPRLSTLTYREYNNMGPGADTAKRVGWKGYNVITNPIEAQKFTVRGLIDGGSWLNVTGVPHELGL